MFVGGLQRYVLCTVCLKVGTVGHVPVSMLYPFYAREENVLSPICTMFLPEFGIMNVHRISGHIVVEPEQEHET